MATFTLYSPERHTPRQMVDLLLAPNSGLTIVGSSPALVYGRGADGEGEGMTASISIYDGSIAGLGIGAGLLLTSGDGAPPATNEYEAYSVTLDPSTRDADLTAAAKAGFPEAGQVEDATVLSFQFTVSDPGLTGIQFDLVFGSDEYPEYSDTDYVDIGAVFINGVNRALFNGQTDQPLSVIDRNLSAGGFRDNTDGQIPIEYDGLSVKLSIVAPVVPGVNTLKIAVGDTGDPIFDSGLFIANLRAVPFSGTGLSRVVQGSNAADALTAGAGNELIDGGSGIDTAVYAGAKANYTITRSGSSYLVTDRVGDGGTDTLVGVERMRLGSQWVALDLDAGGSAGKTARLIGAVFDTAYLNPQFVGIGIALFDAGRTMEQVAQLALDTDLFRQLAGSRSNADFVRLVYQNVVGAAPGSADQALFQGLLDRGEMTQAQLAVLAAGVDLNAGNIGLTGLANSGIEFIPG